MLPIFQKKTMAYKNNDFKGIVLMILISLPVIISTNIDCNGKPFHCVDSTHFMVCVDLGGGVSSTIDDFIIPCPAATECHQYNRFECDFPKKTTVTQLEVIGVTKKSEISDPLYVNSATTTLSTITSQSAIVPKEYSTAINYLMTTEEVISATITEAPDKLTLYTDTTNKTNPKSSLDVITVDSNNSNNHNSNSASNQNNVTTPDIAENANIKKSTNRTITDKTINLSISDNVQFDNIVTTTEGLFDIRQNSNYTNELPGISSSFIASTDITDKSGDITYLITRNNETLNKKLSGEEKVSVNNMNDPIKNNIMNSEKTDNDYIGNINSNSIQQNSTSHISSVHNTSQIMADEIVKLGKESAISLIDNYNYTIVETKLPLTETTNSTLFITTTTKPLQTQSSTTESSNLTLLNNFDKIGVTTNSHISTIGPIDTNKMIDQIKPLTTHSLSSKKEVDVVPANHNLITLNSTDNLKYHNENTVVSSSNTNTLNLSVLVIGGNEKDLIVNDSNHSSTLSSYTESKSVSNLQASTSVPKIVKENNANNISKFTTSEGLSDSRPNSNNTNELPGISSSLITLTDITDTSHNNTYLITRTNNTINQKFSDEEKVLAHTLRKPENNGVDNVNSNSSQQNSTNQISEVFNTSQLMADENLKLRKESALSLIDNDNYSTVETKPSFTLTETTNPILFITTTTKPSQAQSSTTESSNLKLLNDFHKIGVTINNDISTLDPNFTNQIIDQIKPFTILSVNRDKKEDSVVPVYKNVTTINSTENLEYHKEITLVSSSNTNTLNLSVPVISASEKDLIVNASNHSSRLSSFIESKSVFNIEASTNITKIVKEDDANNISQFITTNGLSESRQNSNNTNELPGIQSSFITSTDITDTSQDSKYLMTRTNNTINPKLSDKVLANSNVNFNSINQNSSHISELYNTSQVMQDETGQPDKESPLSFIDNNNNSFVETKSSLPLTDTTYVVEVTTHDSIEIKSSKLNITKYVGVTDQGPVMNFSTDYITNPTFITTAMKPLPVQSSTTASSNPMLNNFDTTGVTTNDHTSTVDPNDTNKIIDQKKPFTIHSSSIKEEVNVVPANHNLSTINSTENSEYQKEFTLVSTSNTYTLNLSVPVISGNEKDLIVNASNHSSTLSSYTESKSVYNLEVSTNIPQIVKEDDANNISQLTSTDGLSDSRQNSNNTNELPGISSSFITSTDITDTSHNNTYLMTGTNNTINQKLTGEKKVLVNSTFDKPENDSVDNVNFNSIKQNSSHISELYNTSQAIEDENVLPDKESPLSFIDNNNNSIVETKSSLPLTDTTYVVDVTTHDSIEIKSSKLNISKYVGVADQEPVINFSIDNITNSIFITTTMKPLPIQSSTTASSNPLLNNFDKTGVTTNDHISTVDPNDTNQIIDQKKPLTIHSLSIKKEVNVVLANHNLTAINSTANTEYPKELTLVSTSNTNTLNLSDPVISGNEEDLIVNASNHSSTLSSNIESKSISYIEFNTSVPKMVKENEAGKISFTLNNINVSGKNNIDNTRNNSIIDFKVESTTNNSIWNTENKFESINNQESTLPYELDSVGVLNTMNTTFQNSVGRTNTSRITSRTGTTKLINKYDVKTETSSGDLIDATNNINIENNSSKVASALNNPDNPVFIQQVTTNDTTFNDVAFDTNTRVLTNKTSDPNTERLFYHISTTENTIDNPIILNKTNTVDNIANNLTTQILLPSTTESLDIKRVSEQIYTTINNINHPVDIKGTNNIPFDSTTETSSTRTIGIAINVKSTGQISTIENNTDRNFLDKEINTHNMSADSFTDISLTGTTENGRITAIVTTDTYTDLVTETSTEVLKTGNINNVLRDSGKELFMQTVTNSPISVENFIYTTPSTSLLKSTTEIMDHSIVSSTISGKSKNFDKVSHIAYTNSDKTLYNLAAEGIASAKENEVASMKIPITSHDVNSTKLVNQIDSDDTFFNDLVNSNESYKLTSSTVNANMKRVTDGLLKVPNINDKQIIVKEMNITGTVVLESQTESFTIFEKSITVNENISVNGKMYTNSPKTTSVKSNNIEISLFQPTATESRRVSTTATQEVYLTRANNETTTTANYGDTFRFVDKTMSYSLSGANKSYSNGSNGYLVRQISIESNDTSFNVSGTDTKRFLLTTENINIEVVTPEILIVSDDFDNVTPEKSTKIDNMSYDTTTKSSANNVYINNDIVPTNQMSTIDSVTDTGLYISTATVDSGLPDTETSLTSSNDTPKQISPSIPMTFILGNTLITPTPNSVKNTDTLPPTSKLSPYKKTTIGGNELQSPNFILGDINTDETRSVRSNQLINTSMISNLEIVSVPIKQDHASQINMLPNAANINNIATGSLNEPTSEIIENITENPNIVTDINGTTTTFTQVPVVENNLSNSINGSSAVNINNTVEISFTINDNNFTKLKTTIILDSARTESSIYSNLGNLQLAKPYIKNTGNSTTYSPVLTFSKKSNIHVTPASSMQSTNRTEHSTATVIVKEAKSMAVPNSATIPNKIMLNNIHAKNKNLMSQNQSNAQFIDTKNTYTTTKPVLLTFAQSQTANDTISNSTTESNTLENRIKFNDLENANNLKNNSGDKKTISENVNVYGKSIFVANKANETMIGKLVDLNHDERFGRIALTHEKGVNQKLEVESSNKVHKEIFDLKIHELRGIKSNETDAHTTGSVVNKVNETLVQLPKSTNKLITSYNPSYNKMEDKQYNLTNTVLKQPTTLHPNLNTDTSKINKKHIATSALAFDCSNHTRGKYADNKDCRKFYICLGKLQPIIGICPKNTVFSEVNKQCTRNLSHCVRNNQFRCLLEGRFSDFLKDNIYYICVKNSNNDFVRYRLQCQEGYHLNKVSVKSENNVEDMSQSVSSVSENSNTMNDQTVSEPKTKEVNDFVCEKEGKYPHSSNCRKYYVCSKNSKGEYRRKIIKCSSDEVYDRKKKKCKDAESNEC